MPQLIDTALSLLAWVGRARSAWCRGVAVVEAEAMLGDSWKTQCLVVIEDDWSVPKPELYEAMAVLGVSAAKLTVDLEPMFHLINGLLESGQHIVTFCWCSTDTQFLARSP